MRVIAAYMLKLQWLFLTLLRFICMKLFLFVYAFKNIKTLKIYSFG